MPDNPGDLPPYKYCKRDVLKPAIAEVRSLTDIIVELTEHKKGRRVVALQFRVELDRQPQLDFTAPPVIDVTLLEKLMLYGLSQQEASDILGKYPDAKVQQAIQVVDARSSIKSSSPIKSQGAYLRWALNNDIKPPEPKPKAVGASESGPPVHQRSKDSSPPGQRLRSRFSRNSTMTNAPRSMSDSRLKNPGKKAALAKALEYGVTRTELSIWYAATSWAEPTIEDLSYFPDKNEVPFGRRPV